MKVAPLITVALILCVAFPDLIQAQKKPKPNKFCVGKDGNRYKEGEGYDDNDGKACVHYTCVKKKKNKLVMQKGKCDYPDINERVASLELKFQSLNDSIQTLQTTMLSVLELVTTMQSTANKQETCMQDLSSSDCPDSAPGKIGVVDGITTNKDDINTIKAEVASNDDDINTNKAEVASHKNDININKDGIAANRKDINTNKDVIASNKNDINTNMARIMENKAAIDAHHQWLLYTDANYQYYKVPVPALSKMTSDVVMNACNKLNMKSQCFNANYADSNCVQAPSISINGDHPRAMSLILCSTTDPTNCASTLNMFWYMKNWGGSACGATKAGSICSIGKDYTSTIDMPYFAACLKPVTPGLLYTDSSYQYYKVPVPALSKMTSSVVMNVCNKLGMMSQCFNAYYADTNCVQAPSNSIHYEHPKGMSQILCSTTDPTKCASTLNMFWYMKNWGGSACGATKDRFCSDGKDYTSTTDMPYFAACLKPVTPGWTIIQRRGQYGNAEDYFYKDFEDYEYGFDSNGELWIGLRTLSALTSDGEWELQVDLTDWDDKNYHAKYGTFSVGPAPTYTLQVGGYDDGESTLGDSMAFHNGAAFSARDKDQDSKVGGSCAVSFKGGWWYYGCHQANLNGLNFAQQKEDGRGMKWWHGKARGDSNKSWKESVMKIKKITVQLNIGMKPFSREDF